MVLAGLFAFGPFAIIGHSILFLPAFVFSFFRFPFLFFFLFLFLFLFFYFFRLTFLRPFFLFFWCAVRGWDP